MKQSLCVGDVVAADLYSGLVYPHQDVFTIYFVLEYREDSKFSVAIIFNGVIPVTVKLKKGVDHSKWFKPLNLSVIIDKI